jgi:hypothetical protein
VCKVTRDLQDLVTRLAGRVADLEKGSSSKSATPAQPAAPVASVPVKKEAEEDEAEEDDFELFDDKEVLYCAILDILI